MSNSTFLNELQSTYESNDNSNQKIFHDTKLLLNLYSKVMWRVEQALWELDAECFESDKKHLYDLVNSLVDVDTQIDKLRFERRMQSIEESKSLIELIGKALAMLKNYPENGERLYLILNNTYVKSKVNRNNEFDLIDNLNISRTTLYREKKRAVNVLGVILWGFILPDFINVINT